MVRIVRFIKMDVNKYFNNLGQKMNDMWLSTASFKITKELWNSYDNCDKILSCFFAIVEFSFLVTFLISLFVALFLRYLIFLIISLLFLCIPFIHIACLFFEVKCVRNTIILDIMEYIHTCALTISLILGLIILCLIFVLIGALFVFMPFIIVFHYTICNPSFDFNDHESVLLL